MTRAWRLAWLPFLLGAGPAFAHSPVPGLEGFYIGMLHPFSTPAQALLMVGMGLLASGYASERERYHFAAFPVATILGLILGSSSADLDPAMFATAFAVCALAALAPGRVHLLAVALVALGGFLIGAASIPDAGPLRDRLFTMSGSLVGANLGLLYLFGIILVLKQRFTWDWVGIALRVAAAWVGAISLLMLALGLAGPAVA
ncbi:HupE/UreJ family protein [Tropicimonas sediminicola]|uniref:HupE / UreJ protein n=1 Tax=Tropicimonas sediminicola TaxID=1031541 RepID=A0A239H6H2_9RHOB|nr:HupE/UreJ family protein [Tropicimonas sediminicola]SNS75874.1 HupE / UreJ protein [Tropicimonas sediminicola]